MTCKCGHSRYWHQEHADEPARSPGYETACYYQKQPGAVYSCICMTYREKESE